MSAFLLPELFSSSPKLLASLASKLPSKFASQLPSKVSNLTANLINNQFSYVSDIIPVIRTYKGKVEFLPSVSFKILLHCWKEG